MPCYHPQLAIPVPGKTQNGKQRYRFIGKAASQRRFIPDAIILPDKQCIGCRLERSRNWAVRLMHEAKFHENACFLSLTYKDDLLPINGSLNKTHLRTFFKDLRARCSYYGKEKIKYFAVGEYADPKVGSDDTIGRPHYHAILYGPYGVFNDDPERTEEEPSRSGGRQFSHADISACWPYGLHRFSEVTFESAAYVARYCLKKISGTSAPDHYAGRTPEFPSISNGLGKSHVEAWLSDLYPSDLTVLPGRGSFMPPPYYDRVLEKIDPRLYESVKARRKEAHEKMNEKEMYYFLTERDREGKVRQLVTEQTLIRSMT